MESVRTANKVKVQISFPAQAQADLVLSLR